MEAASLSPPSPAAAGTGAALRAFFDRYALIIVLALMPVLFAIHDLSKDGNLVHIGTNFKDGLSNGAIWALIALGYTLVYGIIELINFAHGDVFMLGSFVSVTFLGTIGLTLTTGAGGIFIGLLFTM